MANHVTTEWEDIHVKLGNYIATEKQTESNDKLQQIAIEEMQKYDPLENKTVEQLDELEDDEVLKRYKEKRIKELKELVSRPHYGKLNVLKKARLYTRSNKCSQRCIRRFTFIPRLFNGL